MPAAYDYIKISETIGEEYIAFHYDLKFKIYLKHYILATYFKFAIQITKVILTSITYTNDYKQH